MLFRESHWLAFYFGCSTKSHFLIFDCTLQFISDSFLLFYLFCFAFMRKILKHHLNLNSIIGKFWGVHRIVFSSVNWYSVGMLTFWRSTQDIKVKILFKGHFIIILNLWLHYFLTSLPPFPPFSKLCLRLKHALHGLTLWEVCLCHGPWVIPTVLLFILSVVKGSGWKYRSVFLLVVLQRKIWCCVFAILCFLSPFS